MKANNGTGNIPERDTWETPQKLWDNLNKQYSFTHDCCASNKNNKCNDYFNNFKKNSEFCLLYPIDERFINGTFWMNPPFSKAYEMFEHFFKVIPRGVCIYRCDNLETKLWQDIILKHATWILIPKGRVSYEGMKGTGSRFPSALIGFNVDIPKYVSGRILLVKEGEN